MARSIHVSILPILAPICYYALSRRTKEELKMKYKCPVCGSNLQHERVDDGFTINEISPTGEVEMLNEKSNGYDRVFCSKDEEHKINDELRDAVFKLVQ